ncbi:MULTISPECIES: hypothetical protein [Methylobacterium]|jgi:hypothetical protein|uniref:hypothetical protein n=1 Tax=Methylobacterium TaxID=407 RepID=UPI0008EF48B9|nr:MULTISPECIES: hypothetical protein [Methylobacterium]MBZ6415984.1 hypothetical protein [Methylobacterium sp.]MBK3399386.1 hypothetical protein [Methylobacterium ajmalii]MBK3412559.1 hypothetical protein [Methylobacterium ajmalii]MBK3423153.1 hypothetical protein [Methylobacterium ajmalii]SFF63839.1 hypothetical protein SAMN04487844_13349 [Methylobacterium sp. yr596]
MDIQSIFEKKISELPDGPHVDGLRAVKTHIDAAVRHFLRGQSEPDETLFTDVIFRCNQAFEGSIKEAYRVLAGKDPKKVRPYDIEQFLASNNLLRKKVLDQFVNYRQEWRNPSAHDYTIDFDEDEALIAIVSVTVFAIVLTDQIDGKIAFTAAASAPPSQDLSPAEKKAPLLELVTNKAREFACTHIDIAGPTNSHAHDYYRLEGALAGFLSAELSILSDVSVEQNSKFASSEADIVVRRGSEKIIVELKRVINKSNVKTMVQRAMTQVALYLHEDDVVGAVVLVYATEGAEYDTYPGVGALSKIVRIISPKSNAKVI